jgi:hypothetical protein
MLKNLCCKQFVHGSLIKIERLSSKLYTITHTTPYKMQSVHNLPEVLKKESEAKGIDNGIDHRASLAVSFSEVGLCGNLKTKMNITHLL